MTNNQQSSPSTFSKHNFDFIVIGGGTAGLAVASRLAERKELKIGVVEAGSPAHQDQHVTVPAFYGRSIGGQYDWCFETTAQPGLGGRTLPWPRGKAVGGTSAINFMTWVRASRQDYDAWEALGNPGWGWDALLPFFKKSETFHPPSDSLARRFNVQHETASLGTCGPIHISYSNEYSASHALWHSTLNAVGVQTNTAHTAGSNVGVWTNINSVDPRTAARSYATSYLSLVEGQSNLHILTGATVTRISLRQDASGCTADGVVFRCNGQEHTAFASREVILSAGAVQSPQILELSGIGNPDVLARAGISVKIASPCVGENLQDHLMLATIFEVDPNLENPDDLLKDSAVAERAQQQYNENKTGPLTILPCAICYVPLKTFVQDSTMADMQSRATSHSVYDKDKTKVAANRFSRDTNLGQIEYIFDLGNWSTSFKGEDGKKYGTMLQMLQYPFSVGSVHIRPSSSTNEDGTVKDGVVIDPGYYHGNHGRIDLDVMTEAARFLEKIATTKPLANIIRRPVAPEAGVFKESDKLRDWVLQNTITDWHPVGTCGMGGRAGREGGVVNERLQVYGVRNLRVIDASIMPLQISAHLQATVYAIAEKGAHMILEDLDR